MVKKLALSIFPKEFLVKNERFVRSLFAQHYKGKNHRCNICKTSIKKFIKIDGGDLLCPFCGSRARTRRLFEILNSEELLNGKTLHFSPSRSLYRELKENQYITYFSTDFEDEFLADHKYDITNIDCPDASFDLIICYHILEHIEADHKAIQELYRVLKPNGICLVQTPFMDGNDIYEDFSITTNKGRLEAFGQEDHVRVYSVAGLKNRLKKNHFASVKSVDYPENLFKGFLPETVLFLKKEKS